MQPGVGDMPNESKHPPQAIPIERRFDGNTGTNPDPFRPVLTKSIERAFEPIIEKARRKREARETALAAKIEEALGRP